MKYSISFRRLLRVWILSYTALAVLLSGLLFAKYGHDEVGRRLQMAQGMVQLYADDSISIEFGRKNLVHVADALRRLNSQLAGLKTRLRDRDGVIVESTSVAEIGSFPSVGEARDGMLSAVIREHSSNEPLGTLEVFLDQVGLNAAAFRAALAPSLLLLLCLLVLSIFVISSLQRRLIVPIKQLLSIEELPKGTSANWPREISNLSMRLKNALKERDLAMVGQLASGVIHDLKTLLHSTWSAAVLASEQAPSSERRNQRLEALLKAAEANFPKMQALIESTLDGARDIRVEAVPNSVEATIAQAVQVNAELAKRAGVLLSVQVDDDVPLIAQDVSQLERALINIIKNAIEAASCSSSAKLVQIQSALTEDGEVYISVEDSGSGLGREPEAVLTSLRSTKPHGTGLGLVVSRKIIEAHRGRLVAGSSKDLKGAMFKIIVPPVSGGL